MTDIKLCGEYEAQVAGDFCTRLADLVCVHRDRLPPDVAQKYLLLETAIATVPVEVFSRVRDVVCRLAPLLEKRDVNGMCAAIKKEPLYLERGGESARVLEACLELWRTCSKRDLKKSYAIADQMLADCREWKQMMG